MTQLLLLALSLALVGCSTRPLTTAGTPSAVAVAPVPAIVIEDEADEAPVTAPAQAPSPPAAVDTFADAVKSGQVAINKAKKVVTSVKAVVAAVKEVKAQVDTFSENSEPPAVPVRTDSRPTMPVAPPYDSRTGAKIQFLGIDLEFWLGQNDSWSTVFKMLTLLIATYGGFRGINYLFSKKSTAV